MKLTPENAYDTIMELAGNVPDSFLHKLLYQHELFCLARHLKSKFPKDKRTIVQMANLISNEYKGKVREFVLKEINDSEELEEAYQTFQGFTAYLSGESDTEAFSSSPNESKDKE